jgi:hypothetical protein
MPSQLQTDWEKLNVRNYDAAEKTPYPLRHSSSIQKQNFSFFDFLTFSIFRPNEVQAVHKICAPPNEVQAVH